MKTLISSFVLLACLNSSLLAAVDSSSRQIVVDPSKTIESKTYSPATGDSDVSNWNAKDFSNNLGKDIDDAIKNAKMLLDIQGTNSSAYSNNPNNMNTNTIKSADPRVQYFGTSDINQLAADSTGSSSSSLNSSTGTIKCYVSRDIPVQYTCNETGVTVSKAIDSSAIETKKTCDENCFTPLTCVSLNTSPSVLTETVPNVVYNSTSVLIHKISKNTSNSEKIEYIEFDLFVEKATGSTLEDSEINVVVNVDYEENGISQNSVSNLSFGIGSNTHKIPIKDYADKVKLSLERSNKDTLVRVENISIVHEIDSKFACPGLQDISWIKGTSYGDKCPSGNISTFTVAGNTIEICADGNIVGDKRDGTYSSLDACNAICKISHECTLSVSFSSTSTLSTYREGCIFGQPDCTVDKVCEDLRLTGAKVLTETSFNAKQEATNTISAGNQIQGVERPKLLLNNAISYQEKLAEEWKDEGYNYMLNETTYSTSKLNIGDDTEIKSAYSYGIHGLTPEGLPKRALFWLLKPRALDVGKPVYFYNIVEVITEEEDIDISGTTIKVKDRILYTKTSLANDDYKAFAVKRKFAKRDESGSIIQEVENPLATWEFKTFNGKNWIYVPNTQLAEYMDYGTLSLSEPFLRTIIVNDLKNFYTSLNGIIRRKITAGPYVTNFYNGSFDGTGENIGRYAQYAIYSQNRLTYQDLFDAIDTGTIKPIFDNITPSMYPKTITGDGTSTSDIEMFLYGDNTKKDGYVRIFPKDNEIGKKGFLYIFAY